MSIVDDTQGRTSEQALVFNSLTLPLHGKQLVEASAGTGKTHSISDLYLRAVLGEGLPQPLQVQQILVVTFTNAACAELKTRIRKRLIEARTFLASVVSCKPEKPVAEKQEQRDPFLYAMSSDWTREQLTLALIQLELAARSIDESAIFTIHGFCQRALQDSAFLFGLPFEQALNEDVSDSNNAVFKDWWRSVATQYSAFEKQLMAEGKLTPSKLFAKRFSKIDPDIVIVEVINNQPMTSLDTNICQQFLEKKERLKKIWPDAKSALKSYQGAKKRSKPFGKLDQYISCFEAYLDSENLNVELHDLEWGDFTQEQIVRAKLSKSEPLEHPAFSLVSEISALWKKLYDAVLFRLAHQYQEFLRARQQQETELDFDRLISLLNEKMQADQQHVKHLALKYPLIMVDEFQDTDHDQFEIFNSLAGAGSGLLMIGDPKQAIYKFRGADIHAYLAAKDLAQVWTMDTNWRSSQNLITAVNSLFTLRENVFSETRIPFDKVKAAGKADEKSFTIDNKQQAAISFNFISKTAAWRAGDNLQHTAMQVAELLASDVKVGNQALSAGEVAVLVRNNADAGQMQELLAQQGVASILVTDDSVFSMPVARSLLLMLKAMMEKDHQQSIVTALASGLTAYDVNTIRQLQHDTLAVGELQQMFSHGLHLWQRFGITVAMRNLFKRLGIPHYLLSLPGGQRELSDLLHLLELLQSKSRELPGVNALYDWFALQVLTENRDQASDEEKIKLETDHQLVKIATIHRSKGLQYHVVFIPKLNFTGLVDPVIETHENGKHILLLQPEEQAKQQAKQEAVAEDMRLVYVALTRARYKVYANLIMSKGGVGIEKTAAGTMLNFDTDEHNNIEILQKLSEQSIETTLINEAVEQFPQLPISVTQEQHSLQANSWPEIHQQWRVSSFSSLTANLSYWVEDLPPLELKDNAANDEVNSSELELLQKEEDIRFTFTKGAEAGNFIHAVFESYLLQPSRDQDDGVLESLIEKHWSEYQLGMDYELHKQAVVKWLSDVLNVSLANDLNLRGLTQQQCLPEMEFFLANINGISSASFNSVLEEFQYQTEPELQFNHFKGFLKGFIDLIFEHQGKFYVLDYKSNYLGGRFSAYQHGDMHQAIRHHHYQLQYVLYTLALHRYLKSRISDYEYDQHIGGIYYVFVRGMSLHSDTGVYQDKVPKALIEKLDALLEEGVQYE